LHIKIILHSFLTHTLVRHWGDIQTMLLCLARAALYIPLTVALLRRAKILCRRPSEALGSAVPDVFHKVEGECARLADFFQFKKRMDWIGVPVSCAIIVLVTSTLFVEGSVKANPVASITIFALWVGMSLIAIHAENKKRFIAPLRHLEHALTYASRQALGSTLQISKPKEPPLEWPSSTPFHTQGSLRVLHISLTTRR